MDVFPFVLVKLLAMVMQSIRDHASQAASNPALKLLKSMLKPLLYPTHVRARAPSAYHLYAEVSDCLSRALSTVDRVAPLFTAGHSLQLKTTKIINHFTLIFPGASSYNEMKIVLTVLRQSMATSVHSLVSIFEYSSTPAPPLQLLPGGERTRRFDKIRQEFSPPREEAMKPVSDRQRQADTALMVSSLQGLMWQLNNPSAKTMLLPIATLLFDAMQRLSLQPPKSAIGEGAQEIATNSGRGGNEYLLSCFMCVLHIIEELHAIDLRAMKRVEERSHPALVGKVKTSTAQQLLEGLEWFATRDSLRVVDNNDLTRRQVGFALGQVVA